ncbi:MAG: glycosyltransferase 28 domain protein [Crocinitomicaceae bacterium]|jgi:UDP:flavonoid glycosyltransferase YjiC (YdhE family)|nr:glycosyltransferase 28 domain protein [Crocinitomicaceae bacterium]
MQISEVHDKRILYAVLDWGLGHVTRSIGIIRQLEDQGNTVIIACNKEQKQVFVSYLPELIYEELEGYNFRFSGKGNWGWDLWKQRSRFLGAVKKEAQSAKDLCRKQDIELVVSDHRYGFRVEGIPSVFVTHQLHLPIPKIAFLVQRWHEKRLRKFTSLWVLDDEKNTLAGKLSKPLKHPDLNYIGWYSRFELKKPENLKVPLKKTQHYDYLIVLSGPEPYSLQLFAEISRKIDFRDKKVAVLHPASLKIKNKNKNFNYFPAKQLKKNDELFFQSDCIISRSGYSTIMDIRVLGKKAILIPTKGQKEQEYLSRYLKLE